MISEKRQVTEVDKAIGRQVRRARRKLKWSQERLGAALNVSFQQVQKYENGTNRISSAMLFDIARLLDQPISFFYGEFYADPELQEREAQTPGYHSCLKLLQQFEREQSFDFIERFLEAALLTETRKR